MIRVNLLRNLGAGVAPSAGVLSTGGGGDIVSQDLQKQALYRIMAVIGCVALLIFYEKLQFSAKQQELDGVNMQIAQVRAEKDKYGDAGPIVEKYEAQKAKLDGQIKVLESLTENRLREVKLLDTLQSIMPPKSWLQQITVDQGKAMMSGYAPDEAGVSSLYRALEGNVLFSNVKVKSEAVDVPAVGMVQKFEFTFNAGKVK